jgi:LacI family transcriptional regulator
MAVVYPFLVDLYTAMTVENVRPTRRRVLMALSYGNHQMHRGIARFAREAGWILETSMSHYGVIPDYWEGDGILTVVLESRPDVTRYLRRQRVPIVAMSADVPELRIPRVLFDNHRIGQLGAEHLLERGFENLAFYRFSDTVDVLEREEGFCRTVEAAGGKCRLLNWQVAQRRRARRRWFQWLQEQLRGLPLPVGIMAQSDNRAFQLISACEAAGLAVPEQVAVVGVDNDEYACEFASVPTSSVDSNREYLAYEAAALLDRLIGGDKAPAEPMVIAPRGMVVRRSSDMLAIDHSAVTRALSFIWKHFAEPIDTADVVAVSRMSRCGVYRAFEKHVGRSIGDEITRKRLEHAKELLAQSCEKLHRVARASGFGSGEHFSRVFTRVVGMTPSAYRNEQRRCTKDCQE